MDARIGTLQTAEGIVYYAFVDGHDKPEFRSKNLGDVERALGLCESNPAIKTPVIREYEVTITPKYQAYAGSWKSGEYTVDVYARDANEAIKRARQDRIEQEGRLMAPAKYRAKLKSS